ncbi:MAG TPA: hypothetical protein VKY36_06115 [Moheibacter sp.]|nr:hypothetical protein [Moheibacter sp.]
MKAIKLLMLIMSIQLLNGQEIKSISSTENLLSSEQENYGWNKRISFFVGAGTSVMVNKVYELPIIDRTTNNVIIEESGRLKPNVSMGIVYTPFVYTITRTIKYTGENGEEKIKKIYHYEPKHFSVALFINPISFTSANSNLNNTVDLGFGLGWRSDNFSAFLTMEFFSLKQPRDYFIKQYENNDRKYIIDDEIQTSIDTGDNSIFKNKVMTSFGIKLAYTFDIAKSYNNTANF